MIVFPYEDANQLRQVCYKIHEHRVALICMQVSTYFERKTPTDAAEGINGSDYVAVATVCMELDCWEVSLESLMPAKMQICEMCKTYKISQR